MKAYIFCITEDEFLNELYIFTEKEKLIQKFKEVLRTVTNDFEIIDTSEIDQIEQVSDFNILCNRYGISYLCEEIDVSDLMKESSKKNIVKGLTQAQVDDLNKLIEISKIAKKDLNNWWVEDMETKVNSNGVISFADLHAFVDYYDRLEIDDS